MRICCFSLPYKEIKSIIELWTFWLSCSSYYITVFHFLTWRRLFMLSCRAEKISCITKKKINCQLFRQFIHCLSNFSTKYPIFHQVTASKLWEFATFMMEFIIIMCILFDLISACWHLTENDFAHTSQSQVWIRVFVINFSYMCCLKHCNVWFPWLWINNTSYIYSLLRTSGGRRRKVVMLHFLLQMFILTSILTFNFPIS